MGESRATLEATTDMAQEVEIKLQIADLNALQHALKDLRAQPVGSATGRVHESNVIFDTPQGALAKYGQLLRIRTESPERNPMDSNERENAPARTPRTILTFKKPPAELAARPRSDSAHASGHHKIREELEVEVSDASLLAAIFEGLGMSAWFRYEKYRTTFRLPASSSWASGLLIELDETPIGTFVELEGPPDAIDRAARELGYSPDKYIRKSYLALYFDHCRLEGREPTDMLFAAAK